MKVVIHFFLLTVGTEDLLKLCLAVERDEPLLLLLVCTLLSKMSCMLYRMCLYSPQCVQTQTAVMKRPRLTKTCSISLQTSKDPEPPEEKVSSNVSHRFILKILPTAVWVRRTHRKVNSDVIAKGFRLEVRSVSLGFIWLYLCFYFAWKTVPAEKK